MKRIRVVRRMAQRPLQRATRKTNNTELTKEMIRTLVGKNSPLVLEVGCNDGTDSLEFLQTFPGIELHCFDPEPRIIPQFEARTQGDPRCHFYPIALSDQDGTKPFWASTGTTKRAHKADWDMSGSTREPTGHLTHSSWCKFKAPVNVTARSLDSWYAEVLGCRANSPIIDFLWADVQGAEADLIAGAKETLRWTRYFYTEYYDTPMYAGQPTLEGITAALVGFDLLDTYSGNALYVNRQIHAP